MGFKVKKPKHDPFAKLYPLPSEKAKTVIEAMMREITKNVGIHFDMEDGESKLKDSPFFNPPQGAICHPAPPGSKVSEDDMWWKSKDGKKMLASTMATRHLFFSLRLLFNKSVPPEYRVSEYNGSTSTAHADDTKRAIRILFKLLNAPHREKEITDEMWEALIHMQRVVRELL